MQEIKGNDKETRLTITRLPGRNTLIFKQYGNPEFFIAKFNVFVIEIPTLSFLIKFLVQNGFVSKKVLEGILSEIEE